MAKKILLTSLKGGTGVTTCAAGISRALADSGERVLLVDGDRRSASALTVAGVSGLNVYTLAEAEKGACRVKQAVIRHPRSPNFYILPTLGCENEKYIQKAVAEVEGLFDYVICDKAADTACNFAYVVTDPYTSSIKGADICLNEIKDNGINNAGIIVNKVNGGLVFDGEIMTPQEIAALLRAPLLAVIPEDLTMPLGRMKNGSAKAFATAAAALRGKSGKVTNVIRSYAGIRGLIKRKMRAKL